MKKQPQLQYFFPFLYAGIVLLVSFWGYVKTLAPTVSFFDSGELISAAYTFGVAHPPGYPLYVLLGWMFSKLPVGSVAWRINLMSACFASLAALMGYWLTFLIIAPESTPNPFQEGKPTPNPYQEGKPTPNPSQEGNLCSRSGSHDEQPTPASDVQPLNSPAPNQMLAPVLAMHAAFLFAFSLTHWRHAVIAEVYTLNTFLAGLILLLLFTWRRRQLSVPGNAVDLTNSSPSPLLFPIEGGSCSPSLRKRGGRGVSSSKPQKNWLLYLAAWLFGIGFGNHQTIALLSVAACFLVLVTAPRILRSFKTLTLILVFLLLGLSIYLLLPIRAARNPPLKWGNPVTFKEFKWLVMRAGYKNVAHGDGLKTLWQALLGRSAADAADASEPGQDPVADRQPADSPGLFARVTHALFWRQLLSFNPLEEFGSMGLALALLGLVYGLAVARVESGTLLIAVLTMVISIVIIGDPPEENIFLVKEFHSPSYLLVAAWIGMGMMASARAILWLVSKHRKIQYGCVFGMALYFLVLPGQQVWKNIGNVDRRHNYVAYDYASNVLTSLKPNAILFTWGDSGAFPLWYMQIVEGRRPDVTLIHAPHLTSQWFRDLLPGDLFLSSEPGHLDERDLFARIDEIIRKNQGARPIYFDYSSAHSLIPPYPIVLNGITYKVAAPGDVTDTAVWDRYRLRGILDESPIVTDPDIERTFLMYASARMALGNYYLHLDELDKAAREFNLAVQFEPSIGEQIVQELKYRNQLSDIHSPQENSNHTTIPSVN